MTTGNDLKEKAALASIFASAGLTIAKFVAGLLSGSLGLMSEAGHGLLDTGATTLTYFAVKAAAKPADDDHPYGHGKIEAVAALAETGLLLVLAVGVLVFAARELYTGSAHVEANWLTFAVLVVSIGVDAVRWRGLTKIAKETGSEALSADALHFSSDLVSSVLVLIGLAASKFGFVQGDAVAAIGVSLFIGIAGVRLGRRTIDTLVDTAPKGIADQIGTIVAQVQGVAAVESVRLRPAGGQLIGEIGISVPRTLPLERVYKVKSRVETAIAAQFPKAQFTITANPVVLDSETILERILLISAMRRLPVHHITVQKLGEIISVSLDIELDGRMSLATAHDKASKLEIAIKDELGPDVEVETHIEPLDAQELDSNDAEPALYEAVKTCLARLAIEGNIVQDVHSLRVRATGQGIVVNYHCRSNPALSVAEVHRAVDCLDRGAKAALPQITRIVGHCEPIRSAKN
eukprot:gene9556-9632_t